MIKRAVDESDGDDTFILAAAAAYTRTHDKE